MISGYQNLYISRTIACAMSEQTEEYLEIIYRLEVEGKETTTTSIANELKLSPSSVTEMLKKLSELGYVEYIPYQGAALTKKGRKIGKKILRKHMIIEIFLVKLGIKREKAHKEACKLEHVISDEVEEKLSESMESPKVGSSRRTIPSPRSLGPGITSLLGLSRNDTAEIISICGGLEVKRQLRTMGIKEGKIIKFITKQPGGPVVIRIDNTERAIGRGQAMKIMVKRTA